jgi:hypothetical protein
MKLDKKMYLLARQMIKVASDLGKFGVETDNEEAVQHAKELRNAALILREWCDVVRDITENEN